MQVIAQKIKINLFIDTTKAKACQENHLNSTYMNTDRDQTNHCLISFNDLTLTEI